MSRLVLATGNPDKVREIEDIFQPLGLTVMAVTRLVPGWSVEETADTLAGNALLKARDACAVTGEATLADDTGLFVDALGGAPGVRSSRFAGPDATYADNVRALLEALRDVPEPRRGARFRTAVALVEPGGEERTFEGELEGRILDAPRGTEGFGYDPVFLVRGEGQTLAEMPLARKNALSHRARAFRTAAAYLRAWPGSSARPGRSPIPGV